MSDGKTNSQMRVSTSSRQRPLPRRTISSSRAAWASISHGPTPRTADSSRRVGRGGAGRCPRGCGSTPRGTPASRAPGRPPSASRAARRRSGAARSTAPPRAPPLPARPRGRRPPRGPPPATRGRPRGSRRRSSAPPGAGSDGSAKWARNAARRQRLLAGVAPPPGRGCGGGGAARRGPGRRGPRAASGDRWADDRRPRRPPPGAPSTSSAPTRSAIARRKAGLVVDLVPGELEAPLAVGAGRQAGEEAVDLVRLDAGPRDAAPDGDLVARPGDDHVARGLAVAARPGRPPGRAARASPAGRCGPPGARPGRSRPCRRRSWRPPPARARR